MDWLEIQVATTLPDPAGALSQAEDVAACLQALSEVAGVVMEQAGDPAHPDLNALLPDICVKAYVWHENDSPALRARLFLTLTQAGLPLPTFRWLADEDWATAWKAHYHPLAVGRRLWVYPAWEPFDDAPAGALIIRLDPGMAFGSGTHATTQLCLRALEDTLRPGARVLDLGCGSGILGLGALWLGAGRVLAVDNDELAISAAQANATLNPTPQSLEVRLGELADITQRDWDLVVANIQADVIQQLLIEKDLLGYIHHEGRLILSGIIVEQAAAVAQTLHQVGAVILQRREQEGWIVLVAAPTHKQSGPEARHE